MYAKILMVATITTLAAPVVVSQQTYQPIAVGGFGLGGYYNAESQLWSDTQFPKKEHYLSAEYFKGAYYAVGFGGSIITSRSGRAWSNVSSPFASILSHVRHIDANDTLYILGFWGRAAQSTDGAQWEVLELPSKKHLTSMQYFDGRYVISGASGLLLTSTDGTQWEQVSIGTRRHITDLFIHNQQLIAVVPNDGLYATDDLAQWRAVELPGDALGVRGASNGSTVMVVGLNGYLAVGPLDGTFAQLEHTIPRHFMAVVWDKTAWRVVGTGGTLITFRTFNDWNATFLESEAHLLDVTDMEF